MFKVLAFVAATALSASAQPDPQVVAGSDGSMQLKSLGKTVNVSDIVEAPQLMEVERRSTQSVSEIVAGIAASNKLVTAELSGLTTALVAQMGALNRKVEKMTPQQGGFGGGVGGASSAFTHNPFTAELSSLGGDLLTVTFPPNAELIDNGKEIYQCKFTHSKDKTKFRISPAVAALGDRMFSCVAPAWSAPGVLPKKGEHEFVATFDWLEAGRIMPAPVNQSQTVKVTMQQPTFTVVDLPGQFSGKLNTDVAKSVKLKIKYDYGTAGYADLAFSATTGSTTNIKAIAVTGTGADRILSFKVNSPNKDVTKYYIDVTIKSKSYGYTKTTRVNINYKKATGIGEGAWDGAPVLSDATIATLKANMRLNIGGYKGLKLCYSSVDHHGISSSSYAPEWHRKCDGKLLFSLMRDPTTKRVWGGFAGCRKWSTSGGYTRSCGYVSGRSSTQDSWLFKVDRPGQTVQIAKKSGYTYWYYFNSGHHMTFGGGHDWYCNNAMSSCYSNRHSYNSMTSNSWLQGMYSYQIKRGNNPNVHTLWETYQLV